MKYDNDSIRARIQSGEFKVVSKRSRSRVWNVFSRVVDQNGTELKNVICRTCPSVFKFNGSTSNLVRHKCYKNAIEDLDPNESSKEIKTVKLRSCKLSESTEEHEYGADTTDFLDEQNSSSNFDEETKEKLAHALTEWTVVNCRPLSISEDSGLRKLAALLIEIGANYGSHLKVDELMPPVATLSSNIDACYHDTLEKVRSDVCAARANGYSIACSSWPDNMGSTHLCVTINYVQDSSLVSRLLRLDEVSCTGFQLKTQIERILSDFDCDLEEDNPICVTSAESIINAGQIHCISHLLNSIIERAFDEVDGLKEMLGQANELLKYLQKSGASMSLENQMIDYSPSRCHSIYSRLRSIEANWMDIFNLCGGETGLGSMGNININDISSIVHILGHFEKCCRTLEDEMSPTLHLVIPHIHRLRKLCGSPCRTKIESQMKLRLTDSLESLVQNHIGKPHKMAMFLFPPTNQLLQCTQAEKDQTIEECKILMKRYSPLENKSTDTEVRIKQELDDDLFSDFVAVHTSEDRILKEIRRYSDLQVPLSDGYDVLNWWHTNKDNFPLLYRVSCRILGTPASSASSEKAFEKARSLLNDGNYSRVSVLDMANKIMFLHKNYI